MAICRHTVDSAGWFLCSAGEIRTIFGLKEIRKAAVEDLAKVPCLGITLAVDIKGQVQGEDDGRP